MEEYNKGAVLSGGGGLRGERLCPVPHMDAGDKNMMPRRLRAHTARQKQEEKKKGRVTPRGEGGGLGWDYASIWFRLKSDKVQKIPQGSRCDATG